MIPQQKIINTILLVDDDLRLLNSLHALVQLSGYHTITANDGAAAIAILGAQHIDLMLLDLKMPGLSGHQVMDHVEQQSLDTTVIVVSGETCYDSIAKVLRSRAYDYIKKPYAPDELLKTVDNALKQRKLKKENNQIATKLKESERLYRYMVDSSPNIVYMLDEHGNFTFVNDRVAQLLGYQIDDLIGKHYSEIVYFEDLQLARHVFNERRAALRAPRNIELRLKRHAPSHVGANIIPIELNATGVYQAGSNDTNKFIGTYGVIRDISDRKKAERTIKYQAYHDLLTRLPNRELFKDRFDLAISQAKRTNKLLAVMFLDLDQFKLVNDSLGHMIGDALLQGVAKRIKKCVRAVDTLARFGGDEFTLLLPEINCNADAELIAQKIIDQFKIPFSIENNELYVTISIGIAVYPSHGLCIDSLIKCADTAMYYVKGSGKNHYKFFCDELNSTPRPNFSIEQDLRKALVLNQFELYFQPQVNMDSKKIVAVEALIRWNHPSKGLLSPDAFIKIAENTGLILPIGEWVIEKACATLREWRNVGLNDIRMAINLSSLQVEQKDFVSKFINTINKYELVGSDIEAEITENLIMKEVENNIEKLTRLSNYGVYIAIDDFGTGYSSLSYLQKLPIHTLKIDRSFISVINKQTKDACIVDAIAAMSKGLKLNVIAEGVESEAQMSYLLNLKCPCMQGYYFGRPQPVNKIVQLLRNGIKINDIRID